MLKKFSIALACSTLLSMMAFSFDVTSSHAAEGRQRQDNCPSSKVFFNGDVDFSFSKASNVEKFSKNYPDDLNIDISSALSLKFENHLENELVYGANVKVLLSNGGSSFKLGDIGRKGVSVFLQSPYFGMIELGTVDSASAKMMIDASTIAVGDGGIGSTDWFNYVNVEGQNYSESYTSKDGAPERVRNYKEAHPFYLLPQLYTEYGQNSGLYEFFGDSKSTSVENVSPKLSYYSNEFSGLSFGASYAPNVSHVRNSSLKGFVDKLHTLAQGLADGDSQDKVNSDLYDMVINVVDDYSPVVKYENMFSAGMKFSKEFDDALNLEISAVVEHAEHKMDSQNSIFQVAFNDIFGWNIGGKLDYAGFSIVGSYGDVDLSGTAKNVSSAITNAKGEDNGIYVTNPGKTYFWTIGASHSMGNLCFSVGYFNSVSSPMSEDYENTLQHIAVGAEYNIADLVHSNKGKGNSRFGPYFVYHFVDTKEHPVYLSESLEDDENNSGHLIIAGLKFQF